MIKKIHYLFPFIVVFSLIILPEIALRFYGFSYESGISTQIPAQTSFIKFAPDKDLIWKLESGQPNVNSDGFIGKELPKEKEANTYRIIFLGDSCVQQGYPSITQELLNKKQLGLNVEIINLAVSGYSSLQGLKVLEKYGSNLEPDLVFVQFGWNDHWLSNWGEDKDYIKKIKKDLPDWFLSLYSKSKILQLGKSLTDKNAKSANNLPRVVRVSKKDYESNLVKIAESSKKIGAEAIFITAPSAYKQFGVPWFLESHGYVKNKLDAHRLHQEYAEIVRTVAKNTDSHLIDLEKRFIKNSEPRMRELFLSDGIHYKSLGSKVIAKIISKKVKKIINLSS